MNHRQLGMLLLNRMAYGRAAEHLCTWVWQNPEDLEAHLELIWCFNERANRFLNKWVACDEFYKQFESKPNGSALLRFVRGEQLYYDNRERESLDEYHAAIDYGLDSAAVWYSLGCALQQIGERTEASAAYEKVCEKNSVFVPAVCDYVAMLYVDGRFDRVEALVQLLEPAVATDLNLVYRGGVNKANMAMDLARIACTLRESVGMCTQGNFKGAVLHLLPAWQNEKSNLWLLRTIAFLCYRAGWLTFAKSMFSDKIPETSPVAMYARGLVAWYENDCDGALESYTKAVDNGLSHPLVFAARSLVYEEMKQVDKRQKDLERAYALQPWLAYGRANLAENAYRESEFEKVITLADLTQEEREVALRYDVSGQTNVATLDTLKLRSLLQLKRANEALRHVDNDPEPVQDKDLRLARSMVFVDANRLPEASLELQTAITLGDSVIGRIENTDLRRLRRIQKASVTFAADFCLALHPAYRQEYRKALAKLQPLTEMYADCAQLWYHVGNVSLRLGETEKAKYAFRKAISLEPSDSRAYRGLCMMLQAEGDIDELITLSQSVPAGETPISYAMELASTLGDKDLLRRVIGLAMRFDTPRVEALRYLLELTDTDNEFAATLDKLAQIIPIDYQGKAYVARYYLEQDNAAESLARYRDLLAKGGGSPYDVLRLGLAKLASGNA